MSLFIAFLTKDSAYIGVDIRTWIDVPNVGIKTYDFMRKVGSFSGKGKVWVANVGLEYAAAITLDKLDTYSISNIDDVVDINEDLFKESHMEALNKFGIDSSKNKDLQNSMVLLFIGLDKWNKPKMCIVDSNNDYKKEWFEKPGDSVFNPFNYSPIETYLKKELSLLATEIIKKEDTTCEDIIKKMSTLFFYVSNYIFGIGPLGHFVKISGKEVIYRKFHLIRRIFSKIKYQIDYILYLRHLVR